MTAAAEGLAFEHELTSSGARGCEAPVGGARSRTGATAAPSFRRALITGGAGFVGRYLRPVLAAALPQAEIVLTTRNGAMASADCWVAADLTDSNAVNALAEAYRPDLVVHLAAQSLSGSPAGAVGVTWSVNVGGAITLAEALARHTPDVTVLNISSSEVYGTSFLDGPVMENAPLRPLSVYGRTKAVAETVFADILPDTAQLITVRSFNHTGPGQDERFVVPALAAQIARIERGEQASPLRVGNLDSERDFLDVRDVVRAYAGLVAHAAALPRRAVFNVASGRAVPVSEILSRLRAMAKTGISVEQDPARMRVSDIPHAAGDASAIRTAIGWAPEIEMERMLRDVLDALR